MRITRWPLGIGASLRAAMERSLKLTAEGVVQGLRDLARLLTDLEHVQGADRASSTDVGAACVSNQCSRPAERQQRS
ncbi:hypothetical protein ADK55_09350 [Streptomyces sp. WM4235]|nr:hypothetical protein ADK55_09350 [Streptomyces sp. WM4235]